MSKISNADFKLKQTKNILRVTTVAKKEHSPTRQSPWFVEKRRVHSSFKSNVRPSLFYRNNICSKIRFYIWQSERVFQNCWRHWPVNILISAPKETRFSPFFPLDIFKNLLHFSISCKVIVHWLDIFSVQTCVCVCLLFCAMWFSHSLGNIYSEVAIGRSSTKISVLENAILQ